MYRIYNPNNNIYSRGGSYLHQLWSKRGKVWTHIGYLNSHLTLLKENCNKHILQHYIDNNCVIVNVITNEEIPIQLMVDNPNDY